MKPLRLTLAAFGPYVAEQEIDFRALASQRIFLVTGPTGSGKTTLLDAICYALYGETSGGERDPRQMRCQLAAPSTVTEVTLDFALGEQRYRVTRSPEQERAKLRGSGTTRQRARATLWRLAAGREEVLASQYARVTERVEQLLGLRGEQFRQTVLLPQGQFRRLLIADSRQRQQVLESLFRTGLYRQIEEALREEARAVRQELSQADQEQRLILEQAGAESTEALRQLVQRLQQRRDAVDSELDRARERARQAARALAAAREQARRLDELASARAALDLVEAREPAMAGQRERLERGRRAAALVQGERRLLELEQEREDAARQLELAGQELCRSRCARGQSRHALQRELGREDRRGQLQRHVARLESLAQELERIDEQHGKVERRLRQLTAQRDELRESLEQQADELSGLRQQLELSRQHAAALEHRRAHLRGVRQTLTLSTRLERAQGELKAARETLGQAREALERLERQLTASREDLAHQEQQWREGQAALLAAQLEPGAPCPVCGATEHPHPTTGHEGFPDRTRLDTARQALRRLEQDREAAREEAARRTLAELRLATEVVTLSESLGPAAADSPTEQRRAVEQAEQQVAEAEAAGERCAALERQQSQLEQDERAARGQLDRLQQQLLLARARGDELRRALQQQRALLPPGPEGAASELDAARKALARLTRRLQRTREADRVAGEACAAREEASRQAETRAELAARRHQQAEQAFARELLQRGFAAMTDYRDARLSPEELERLEQQVGQHRAALQGCRERLRLAREHCPDTARPDLPALVQADEDAALRAQELGEERGHITARLAQHEQLLHRLLRIRGSVQRLERRHGTVGQIAEVAGGNNPLRISFQRFVLASLLDLVLEAASRRLRAMSRGRYDLQRVRVGPDLRRAGGLDLTVFDGYSGTERPVHTLSGGESFLAALSLALGLADVVQAHAGGLRLGTVFIDEGFGSLDPEAFELAYRALVDLEGGERLVGIISHVPELREWIPSRLDVVPGRGGSAVRQVAPAPERRVTSSSTSR